MIHHLHGSEKNAIRVSWRTCKLNICYLDSDRTRAWTMRDVWEMVFGSLGQENKCCAFLE